MTPIGGRRILIIGGPDASRQRIADAVGHAYHPRDGVNAGDLADAVGAYVRRHEHPAVLPAPSEQVGLSPRDRAILAPCARWWGWSVRKRIAKKLLDRAALEFARAGCSRYTVPEHLACRAAVRLPEHPFVRLMAATDALVFGDRATAARKAEGS